MTRLGGGQAVGEDGVRAAGEAEGASERFGEGDRDGSVWVGGGGVEGLWGPSLQRGLSGIVDRGHLISR